MVKEASGGIAFDLESMTLVIDTELTREQCMQDVITMGQMIVSGAFQLSFLKFDCFQNDPRDFYAIPEVVALSKLAVEGGLMSILVPNIPGDDSYQEGKGVSAFDIWALANELFDAGDGGMDVDDDVVARFWDAMNVSDAMLNREIGILNGDDKGAPN